jgi:predicted Zn-dependent peptidase
MIRRGRPGFRITDPDYPGLCVLETILGGYYGSRLMRNIREEKGYTYGIDTELDTYRFDGTFGISADVANENVEAVRQEILIEMDKLRQDLVPDTELAMVRAYLIGGLVQDLDGPLAVSARYRSAIIKEYDAAEHLRRLDETIRSITAEEIRDLAAKYLRPELDWEVIVGGAGPQVQFSPEVPAR